MTTQLDVTVRLDDRVRLMSAVLAATDWPLKSQTRKPHGTHLHARSTRKFLEVVKNHPAVQSMQGLLDQNAPLEAFFTFALQLKWPDLEMSPLPTWVRSVGTSSLKTFMCKLAWRHGGRTRMSCGRPASTSHRKCLRMWPSSPCSRTSSAMCQKT